MRIEPTPLPGVCLIDLEPIEDERGMFARTFCRAEMEQAGLNPHIEQCNVSLNRHAGTLRGMHYQAPPHGETKVVRVTRGAAFDVAVDLRPDSPTFRQWFGTDLSSDNRRALYIPEACAHGFLTLSDDTEVHYLMGAAYVPEAGRGVRWNDPALAIDWPGTPIHISERDRAYPDLLP